MLHSGTFRPPGEAGRYQPVLPRRKCRGAVTRLGIMFLLSGKIPALALGGLGVMPFGKMPACLKDWRVLRSGFITGGCFSITAGNAAVCGSSLVITGEAAAGPLAVRRLERVKAAHSQSSGEAASPCVSRGRITHSVMEDENPGGQSTPRCGGTEGFGFTQTEPPMRAPLPPRVDRILFWGGAGG
jgi:hypothetical protein